MRKAVLAALAAAMVAAPAAARADGVAVGVFVGEPLGLDLLAGLRGGGALDVVVGVASVRGGGRDTSYGHLTYLHTLAKPRGRSISLPLRLGVGGALSGVVEGEVAARVPLQLGLQFRGTPLELYGELSFVLQLIDSVDTDVDGGLGVRLFL